MLSTHNPPFGALRDTARTQGVLVAARQRSEESLKQTDDREVPATAQQLFTVIAWGSCFCAPERLWKAVLFQASARWLFRSS
jgi:hypothetical protein